jgi:hypothetical protein
MNNEFKKSKSNNETRYTLESMTAGATGSGSVATATGSLGKVQKRGNILAQEAGKDKVPATTPRNFVAKNAKTSGAGAHKDKKKEQKQGAEKHKKPYMESLRTKIDQLKSKLAEQGVAEAGKDVKDIWAADTQMLNILLNPDRKQLTDYTPEEISQLQKLAKILGRARKIIGGKFTGMSIGQVLDKLEDNSRLKQRDGGKMPDFTGRATTTADMGKQIALHTNGNYYTSQGKTWTSGRTGQRIRDANDYIKYNDKKSLDDAWAWVQSKGKQVNYRDNFNQLQTAVQIGSFIVEPNTVTRDVSGSNPDTEHGLSVRSVKSLSQWSRKREEQGVAEGDRPFRGVGGAFNRGDDERHDLDPTDWYVVKDGKMFKTSVYPNQVQLAIAQGYSRTRDEAKAKAGKQGVAESFAEYIPLITLVGLVYAYLKHKPSTPRNRQNFKDIPGFNYSDASASILKDVLPKVPKDDFGYPEFTIGFEGNLENLFKKSATRYFIANYGNERARMIVKDEAFMDRLADSLRYDLELAITDIQKKYKQGTAEGVRDLGYDAQSLIMKLRRDVEEKRLQPTPQAVLAAAKELAGDMEFAPQLLVKQVLGQGVAEGFPKDPNAPKLVRDRKTGKQYDPNKEFEKKMTSPEVMAQMKRMAKKEGVEDRTSYQVAKILSDRGIKYDPAQENELINAIGMVLVKELNMSPKEARNLISYDEDFVADTLGELRGMEQSVPEVDVYMESLAHSLQQVLSEKAVSKKQQKFMGMVHAAQKGEKPASKEVAKVAKTMKKGDAEDFASTKHKGLPEKKKSKK